MSADANCLEIELSKKDCREFQLDTTSVLLEFRPASGLYGIFYTAKGMQWDLWSDLMEEETERDISFARNDPVKAACGLLGRQWRPDFLYEPEE